MASEQQNGRAALTVPADLAEEIERGASRAGTSVADYLREVLHQQYVEDLQRAFARAREYVKTLPPTPYTEEDVPRLVKEARRELWAEREKQLK